MNPIQRRAFSDVKAERDYQDKQWNNPGGSHSDVGHESTDSFRRYIDEYNTPGLSVRGKPRSDREKFIKVAALALAAVEMIDAVQLKVSGESTKGLKVYVSAHDIDDAKLAAEKLKARGFEIVSTWHVEKPVAEYAETLTGDGKRRRADSNAADLAKADIYLGIVEDGLVTGGKFVEQGRAAGLGLTCYIYGDKRENLASYGSEFHLIDDLNDVIPF